MRNLICEKESKYRSEYKKIKIIIDGKTRFISKYNRREYELEEEDKIIYMKSGIFKSNKIEIPKEEGTYLLTWVQSYSYIIFWSAFIFIFVLFFLYNPNDQRASGLLAGLLMLFLWNDCLVKGRKIVLVKQEQ